MELEMLEENRMEVIVLKGLVEICKKLAENSTAPAGMQAKAGQFVEQYNSLISVRGTGTTAQHALAEELLIKIARFLPRVLEVDAREEPESEGSAA